jgi:hypothetical protein
VPPTRQRVVPLCKPTSTSVPVITTTKQPANQPEAASINEAESQSPSTEVDWHAAADAAVQRVAKAVTGPPAQHQFGSHDRTAMSKSSGSSFEWNPEQKAVGVSGGVPYLRVGKRCVLVLMVLPACAFGGEPPKPNGELFKHMHDEPSLALPETTVEASDTSSVAAK